MQLNASRNTVDPSRVEPSFGETVGRDLAVIDVGSNSVRLVLYRVEGRAIWTVFNEKVLAGLGRRVGEGRRLSPEGVSTALSALRRFRAVLDGASPAAVFAVATAAVREADDGAGFITRVQAETGIEVRVLSGAEEARYAALGVLAGQADASGIVGDLGGSSLELVRIGGGSPGEGVTLRLGPFALGAPGDIDLPAVRAQVAERLSAVDPDLRGGCFHAVGGAWRNIALIHMEATGYPLRMVQQYEMTAQNAREAARFVARQSKASLEQIPGVSRKRAETLPYAALVLEALVSRLQLERICFSAYGLREGLILESMPQSVRELDPLVEGCATLSARSDVANRLGRALHAWLTPLWRALPPLFSRSPGPIFSDAAAPGRVWEGGDTPDRDAVLLAAVCRLANLGSRLHPDHRADLVCDQVLRAPIAGQSHPERAFLAAAVFARHTAQTPASSRFAPAAILSPERLRRARVLGAAMRLGCDLSGRTPELLAACSLSLERGSVVLSVRSGSEDLLLGEQTRKRLQALAALLDAGHSIRAH